MIKRAITKVMRLTTSLTDYRIVASPAPVPVPITDRHVDRQVARDTGEWYLHTVIGR